MTIKELIQELQTLAEQHGGDQDIFIKDADTGHHLLVMGTRESNNVPGRYLVCPEQYSDMFAREDKKTKQRTAAPPHLRQDYDKFYIWKTDRGIRRVLRANIKSKTRASDGTTVLHMTDGTRINCCVFFEDTKDL